MTLPMSGLRVENLAFQFYQGRTVAPAIRDISFDLGPSEFLVILGPSGSGKTTLLRLVAGLEKPAVGKIFWENRDITALAPAGRNMALVFQNGGLLPFLTVADNLRLGLKLRKFPKPEIDQRVATALDRWGLQEQERKLPDQLSAGQRQRVSLARALILRPQLFLLDEPLSHLDPLSRLEWRSRLIELQREIAVPFLYVTHDQEEALALGQRILFLNQGTVEQIDPPAEIYRRPASLFVAGFFGSPPMNLFQGVIRQKLAGWEFVERPFDRPTAENGFVLPLNHTPFHLPAPQQEHRVWMGIRPEDIELAPSGPPTITAELESDSGLGKIRRVQYRTRWNRLTALIAHSLMKENSSLLFEESALHFFDPISGKNLAPE